MKRLAPAKVNLGLHVLRRREDGFHEVETILLAIPWVDVLTVRPAPSLHLGCTDPTLPTGEENLVLRAARRLSERYEVGNGAALHLEKHLPHGAGLGGGSSDAAATLQLLAEFWMLDVTPDALHDLAAGLGADVPFFLKGGGAALATGRGEQLTVLDYVCPFHVVIVVPPVRISTAEAYRLVEPNDEARTDLIDLVGSNNLLRWRKELVNDFESPIFERYPEVARLKEALLSQGAGYASLSGSGAAVFGVFEDLIVAATAARVFEGNGRIVWMGSAASGVGESRNRG